MRLARLVSTLPLVALAMLSPASVLADHCGAGATVTPTTGTAGTTFVFETNLGAPSDLHLYRDGKLVATVFLDDSDDVSYPITTGPGAAGAWRARAEVRGNAECAAEATFAVLGTPETSTVSPPAPRALPWPTLLVAGGGAFAAVLLRSGRRRRRSRRGQWRGDFG